MTVFLYLIGTGSLVMGVIYFVDGLWLGGQWQSFVVAGTFIGAAAISLGLGAALELLAAIERRLEVIEFGARNNAP